MKSLLLVRWLLLTLLVAMAYLLGRWQAPQTEQAGETAVAEATAAPAPSPQPSREERLIGELRLIAEAARHMPEPDARTRAYFENLRAPDLVPVSAFIEQLPPGNERDLFRLLLLRTWAGLDGGVALVRAGQIPALSKRLEARLTVFEMWARHDGPAAMLEAQHLSDPRARFQAMSAVLAGVATTDPRAAIDLLQLTPPEFGRSPAALNTARLIANAAYGTGKREAVQELVAALNPGDLRSAIIDGLIRNWGIHFPDDARAWVEQVTPPGDVRQNLMFNLVTAFAQHAPEQAADWAAGISDEQQQASLVAAAIAQWVQLDVEGAETWLNEQPPERPHDGSSYVIALHHLNTRDLQRAFAWIQRIERGEARSEMLANLGRVWSQERPEEFKRFLDQTSLNRIELDLLLSKVPPGS